ncbi:MAG: hypothetical protein KDM81_10420, partial [Verrucomicrobiae bacterium]|nr:hypothetical protein [Verrucomicrobiae bacterium]
MKLSEIYRFLLTLSFSVIGVSCCCVSSENCDQIPDCPSIAPYQGCLDCDYKVTRHLPALKPDEIKGTPRTITVKVVDRLGFPIGTKDMCPRITYTLNGKAHTGIGTDDLGPFKRTGPGTFQVLIPQTMQGQTVSEQRVDLTIRTDHPRPFTSMGQGARFFEDTDEITIRLLGWRTAAGSLACKQELDCLPCAKVTPLADPVPKPILLKWDQDASLEARTTLEPKRLNIEVVDQNGAPFQPEGLCAEILFDRIVGANLVAWKFE